ncbi:M48 family metalloprotease [Microbispora sp. NPDC088329]|uniref:M48 family metalloprotease n=1 Tax=Microbispora sp. NPDC088329 TaxID=3154869 RepID=UPI003431AE47
MPATEPAAAPPLGPARAAAVLDRTLAALAGDGPGETFMPHDLAGVLIVTGRSKAWLHRQLTQRVKAGLLTRRGDAYQVSDAEGLRTAAGADPAALTALVGSLSRAADLPAVAVLVNHDLEDNAVAVRTDCHRTPLVELGANLLDGSDKVLAATVAHELAHIVLGHETEQRTVWAERVCGLSALGLAAVIAADGPLVAGYAAAALSAAAHLVGTRWQRQKELAADRHAVTLLDQAGMDGYAAMAAMLRDIGADESAVYRCGGWIASSHPTAIQRFRAVLAADCGPRPRRRLRWGSLLRCTSTGHRVGSRGHRHAHQVLAGGRCWPWQWRWLPAWGYRPGK